jgi:SAM-dependent methyltransferase
VIQYHEQHSPPPNLPPGGNLQSRLKYFLRISLDLMISSVLRHLHPWLSTKSGTILEVGCGLQPYRHLIPDNCTYQGLDWEKADQVFDYMAPNTIYYDGLKFPFPNNEFESLFHTEVLEHIYNTNLFLSECNRVLKNNGLLFFSVPFQARYHYIPNDYWRFTPASLEIILRNSGFNNIKIINRGTDITVAAYKVLSIIYRWLRGNLFEKFLGFISIPVGVFLLIIGHCTERWEIGSRDDSLGYCIICQKN